MRYFLSYVEQNHSTGHTALMLSVQRDDKSPVEIIAEIGFGPSPFIDPKRFSFFSSQGEVREENNASIALYSQSIDVTHRTYAISQQEAEKFFEIINRDRRINISEITRSMGSTKLTFVVSGPDYDKIRYNCKKYALDVLSELGIVEAKELSNFLIQRPLTHKERLSTLSDDELACPFKEKLAEKITLTLTQLNKTLEASLKNRDSFHENIKGILDLSSNLIQTKEKVGIDPSFPKKLKKIDEDIDPLLDSEEKKELRKKIKEILEDIDILDKLSDTKELRFFWKQPPSLARRFVLAGFTPEEKARYFIDAKTTEIAQRFQNMISHLNKNIGSNRLNNPALSLDLIDLKEIIEDFKKRLDQRSQLFLSSIDKLSSEQIIQQCINQGERLNDLLTDFNYDISSFTPRTKEASIVIRLFKAILSHILRSFFTVENALSVIKAEHRYAEKINKKIDFKVKLSEHSGFFRTYCDIVAKEPDPAHLMFTP